MITPTNNRPMVCRACGDLVQWEQLAGCRVAVELNGQTCYRVRCGCGFRLAGADGQEVAPAQRAPRAPVRYPREEPEPDALTVLQRLLVALVREDAPRRAEIVRAARYLINEAPPDAIDPIVHELASWGT